MIAFALAVAVSLSDRDPDQLSDYVDCLYQVGGTHAASQALEAQARADIADAQLRKCSRLREVGVKALPFYKPRFKMIDENFRKSLLNAQD